MKKTPEQVKKLVETYLKTEHVHSHHVLNIDYTMSTTYDGDYPSFTITYQENNKEDDKDIFSTLTEGIEQYTNLKHKRDYWIGVSWTWNL